ncbi:hypothetical protein LWC35_00750 [Pseudonocardia kujensis]|uniref:M14 family zinc carboxypeptidase n=1 Tax=Pseudonocardia kujensis TaxID=1128675 RepID=UPI001E397F17|nr:M14 family zinc carboxypeptidase [Pseudonocardia kujensis]MCE0761451.1 hypothetical protein [Pseudonocardia kujensis]
MAAYYNVDEVESALKGLANTYPDLCELLELPNRTHEGRTCHALRMRKRDAGYRTGVLFTAAAHAREWGGSECAVNFAADLLEKYTAGTGLRYGKTAFDADQIRAIVENVDVFVVACVNPDGRNFSQQGAPGSRQSLWRKNRAPNIDPEVSAIGTDINRNFPFLWSVHDHFSPSVLDASSLGSSQPSKETYYGSAPKSEPETRNVIWLLDEFPQIEWLLDIHSYGGDVLYSWGDAPNQNSRPEMNFHNRRFDQQRGTDDVSRYGEYIDPDDERRMREVVSAVTGAVSGVRGQDYTGKQAFYLTVPGSGEMTYPTSGTVDDYAYSRHIVDGWATKVLGFTIEFGLAGGFHPPGEDFHPPWEEMEKIVLDVSAGMVAFCVQAVRPPVYLPFDPHVVAPEFRPDFWVLSGIIDGGPGWVLVNNRPVFVKPPDPRLQDLLTRVGEYLAVPELQSSGAVERQRVALEKVIELSGSLLKELG